MLRRILLASAGAMALAGTAVAADLPSRAPPPVFLPPPPVFTWTGLYVGINAGYTWGASNNVTVSTAPGFISPGDIAAGGGPFGVAAAVGANGVLGTGGNSGFIGGGQIGYNFQFYNSWLIGIEADIQGIAGTRSSGSLGTSTPIIPGSAVTTALSASKSLDYLGTVRGRFGFLVTPTLLIYGTGGLAYGGANANVSIVGQFTPPPNPSITEPWFSNAAFSDTRVGWTAGGGLEWLFAPNWSAKVEYLYYDLGTVSFNAGALVSNNIGGAFGGGNFFTHLPIVSTRFNGNIVRAGLNYHFNLWGPAPIVAKY
ncbi:MAG: outer membrane protein [Methylocella sp.]